MVERIVIFGAAGTWVNKVLLAYSLVQSISAVDLRIG